MGFVKGEMSPAAAGPSNGKVFRCPPPKAPLSGELSAKLTERSSQICDCRMPPAALSFPSCRKR